MKNKLNTLKYFKEEINNDFDQDDDVGATQDLTPRDSQKPEPSEPTPYVPDETSPRNTEGRKINVGFDPSNQLLVLSVEGIPNSNIRLNGRNIDKLFQAIQQKRG